MDNKEEVVLDYSRDPMVVDLDFQALMHSKIAKAAKIIEDLYECAQDIQGVVQDGELYVLRCNPLILQIPSQKMNETFNLGLNKNIYGIDFSI